LDLGADKQIPFNEGWRLQFRAEAFNILNRAQLDQPQADLSAGPGEFGVITQPVNTTPIGVGTPRQIQLALQLEFLRNYGYFLKWNWKSVSSYQPDFGEKFPGAIRIPDLPPRSL
jgi:hypothetical protein